MRYGRLAAAICVALTAAPAAAHAASGRRSLLVALASGARPRSLPGATAAQRLDPFGDAYRVVVRPTELAATIARWRHRPGVLAVQRDWRIRAAQSESALCTNPPASFDAGLIQAIGENGFTPPASTPPVAVLDSGIDATRPEFAGRVRDPISVVSGPPATVDTDGHGTAVAGAAAASSAQARGSTPTSPVMPVKILAPDGSTTAALLIQAIDRAVAAGAGVINLSESSPLAQVPAADGRVVQLAIDRAFSHGVLVVAASGNEGSGQPDVPAAYPHVLSVAATGISGRRATFSNYGSTIDLSAPGVELTEPAPFGVCASGYQLVSGTSFAAPAVAGAAAILEAERPSLTPSQRFEMLRRSASQPGGMSGWTPFTGFGVLNVAAAVAGPAPPATPAEVNDDVFWVKGRPPLARSTGTARVSGRIDAAKNPIDVFLIRLRKGSKVNASLTLGGSGRAQLSLWDAKTGPFDITTGRTKHRLALANAGATLRARRAGRAGTYYLSVRSTSTPPGGTSYKLVVTVR